MEWNSISKIQTKWKFHFFALSNLKFEISFIRIFLFYFCYYQRLLLFVANSLEFKLELKTPIRSTLSENRPKSEDLRRTSAAVNLKEFSKYLVCMVNPFVAVTIIELLLIITCQLSS